MSSPTTSSSRPPQDVTDRADAVSDGQSAGEGRLAQALLLRHHPGSKAASRYEQEFNSDGDKFGDDTWRSHLYTSGKFAINKDWIWGFGIERQTDDLYDQRYDIDGEDDLRGLIASQPRQLLTQAYVTGQEPDFYFEAGTFLFQGLRAGDIDAEIPRVVPSLFAEKVLDFGPNGGQLAADFSAVGLLRDKQTFLPSEHCRNMIPAVSRRADSARATASADWRAMHCGTRSRARTLCWSAAGISTASTTAPRPASRDVTRALGVAGAQVSYPMISRNEGVDIIIEPIAMIAYGTPDANRRRDPQRGFAGLRGR